MTNPLHILTVFFLIVIQAMNEEQRINVCKAGLNQIYDMLHNAPRNWKKYIDLAKTITAHLDSTTFMQQPCRVQEQTWMIGGLQRLASIDAEGDGINDLATWCSRQWLVLYQRDPQNIAALRGIGQFWLSRAQLILTRIYRKENSSSSTSGSQSSAVALASGGMDESVNQNNNNNNSNNSNNPGIIDSSLPSAAETESRLGTADYVEVRGYLHPATEYFDKAVAAASAQEVLSGELLAIVSLPVCAARLSMLTRIGRRSVYVPGKCIRPSGQRRLF